MIRLLLLGFAFVATAAAQFCTTSTCTLNCVDIDYNIQRCGFDYTPYDNQLSCLCRDISGLKANTGILNSCVACNQDGLGSSSLAYYQILTAACDLYLDSGEAAAVSLVASPSTAVIAVFSSSYLPKIRAVQCSSAVTSIASGSPSVLKTSLSVVTGSQGPSTALSATSLPTGITASSQISNFPSTIGTALSSATPASDSGSFTSISGSALSFRSGGKIGPTDSSTTQQPTNAVQQPTATTSSRPGNAARPQQEPVLVSMLIGIFALFGLM